MKKIIYTLALASTILFSACEDALDTSSYTKANTGNYPSTLTHAKQLLAGVYNNLNEVTNACQESFFYASELASDDQLGGGGANDKLMQAMDLLCNYQENMTADFWKARYKGIYRANEVIESLPKLSVFESDDQKNQMIGEAYFLRAFYYYELASMYENIPLITSTATGTENVPQAAVDSTWGQIAQDLKTAITMMPAKKVNANWVEDGHVDKWCAEAMMGRVFLFYTGFYGKSEIALNDGSKITKKDVSGWIDDCVNNSGYTLVPKYQNLWPYTNSYTKEEYTYTKGQDCNWVENSGARNPESMFKIKYSELASWDAGNLQGYCNLYALQFGIRGGQDLDKTFPFGQGWGAGPVSPSLWEDWDTYDAAYNKVDGAVKADPRRQASVCDIPTELPKYTYGGGGWQDMVQETDYYQKKLGPITCATADGSGYYATFECRMFPNQWGNKINDMQLDNIHDLILLRFADVLLMQSELEQSVDGINKVRARAGLPAVSSYSLALLQQERRFELSCEGVRWNDMRRWGSDYAIKALEEQNNVKVYYKGTVGKNTAHNGGYAARYKATRGFFKIPEGQISLSDNVLKQNAGWTDNTSEYAGW